jgi:hypothetical protein
MPDQLTVDEQIERLRNRGDAHGTYDWPEGDPDYIAGYSLTAEHIPALIALAVQWIDSDADDDSVYGPIHAWRALGQLRAVQAVQPLLDMMDSLGERHDDWYLEEFPHIFRLIGVPAIAPLTAYLADDSHLAFPRVCAADGLREIAMHHPDKRSEVVAVLTAELARHQKGLYELNGLLTADLLDLKAVESAETIERAFAANVIDETITGNWECVRKDLGVPGLGLVPDRSPGRPIHREQFGPSEEFRQRFVSDDPLDAPWDPLADRQSHFDAKREARAKRKTERKNRKRNRKSR